MSVPWSTPQQKEVFTNTIRSILSKKGCSLFGEIEDQKSIKIKCGEGHTFSLDIVTLRNKKLLCDECSGSGSKLHNIKKVLEEVKISPIEKFSPPEDSSIIYDLSFTLSHLPDDDGEGESGEGNDLTVCLDFDCFEEYTPQIEEDVRKKSLFTMMHPHYINLRIGKKTYEDISLLREVIISLISDKSYDGEFTNPEMYVPPAKKEVIVQPLSSSNHHIPDCMNLSKYEEFPIGRKLDDYGNPKSSYEEYRGEKGCILGKRPAIAYCRYSTKFQSVETGGNSLQTQQTQILEYCMKNSLYIRKFFIDRGLSGRSIVKRDAVNCAVNDLQPGEFLIVHSISRFGRSTTDVSALHSTIQKEKRATLCPLDIALNTSEPIGKLVTELMTSISQFEVSTTSMRVSNTLNVMSANGELQKKPPFGMRKNKETGVFEEDPEEVKIIEDISSLREKNPHWTVSQFCKYLNDKHIKCRKAKMWYPSRLQKILEENDIESTPVPYSEKK